MLRSYPLLSRFVLLLVVPLVAAAALLAVHFTGTLPPSAGQLAIPGIATPITIERDRQGVPHITAQRDRDVYFAMGYVHAQDRLWQLEVQRRIATGRLSEIFGRSTLQQDVWLRTLSLREAAAAAWDDLGPQARESLTAYAAGINAWLSTHTVLPPEFAILDVQPEPWTPVDSLAWSKVFALSLAGNFEAEIAAHLATRALSRQQLRAFFGFESSTTRSAALHVDSAMRAHLLALGEMKQTMQRLLRIGGPYVGSNAWAISGKLTRDGTAILANDPHMQLEIPSIWYAVVQRGEHLSSSGMSLVGLPLVIFGQNGSIAWGGTNLMADVQDLYFEDIDASDAGRYRVGNDWQRLESRIEHIAVRADFPESLRQAIAPVRIEVRRTRNGPIISDAIGGIRQQPLALRWTALDPKDKSYEALLQMNFAQDWAGFKAALQNYAAPALNLMYADRAGNIGHLVVGKVPLRSRGNGGLPNSGASELDQWRGYIPVAELPQRYNPSTGFLVSANDDVTPPDYPYFISKDFAPAARARRIAEMIEGRIATGAALTVEDSARIQGDVFSPGAARLLQLLHGYAGRTAQQREALQWLRGWRGEMRADGVAPSIFNVWMSHLAREVFTGGLQQDWTRRDEGKYLQRFLAAASFEQIHAALDGGTAVWCDQGGSAVTGRECQQLLSDSLDAALRELQKLAGSDMKSWEWGKLHQARYAHNPFSGVRLLEDVFERRSAAGGSLDTVNVANYVFDRATGYRQTIGAAFRQVMRLGVTTNQHFYMNSTGQSGNVLSPHYADMLGDFSRSRLTLLQRERPDGVESTITLVPRGAPKGMQ